MAADPSAYHLGIGRFDECCQERSFGFSLVGIVFTTWALIEVVSLLPTLEPGNSQVAYLGNNLIDSMGMYNVSKVAFKKDFFGRPAAAAGGGVATPQTTDVSVEIGSMARGLHVVAVGGCLVSLFIWCWLGLLRRYTDENKIIKVVNVAFNTATQMCIVVCAIVWCVGLDDGTPQAAWPPLLLWHTALCFFGSFVFAWCLLVIPNKVLQFPPKGAATERIQKV